MSPITRRTFIKGSLILSGAALAGPGLLPLPPAFRPRQAPAGTPDLSVVIGRDWFSNTVLAVDRLGGMGRFVKAGDRVALLANVPFKNYGTTVKPEILAAVIRMCLQAGAKEIRLIKEPWDGYWSRNGADKKYAAEIAALKPGWEDSVEVNNAQAVHLKEPNVRPALLEAEVFINVSIIKQHDGVGMSCTLKNMMGSTTTMTNMWMHFGGKKRFKFYPDPDYLAQCIVDLNRVKTPALCLADATEFITAKGPYGPGPLKKPQQIVAGLERPLVDAYCATLLGLVPDQVAMIKKAAAQGLGSMDLGQAEILKLARG